MSFQLKHQMKFSQRLAMTAQLQQSIKLLTLPCQELKETIQKELMENPLLEEKESDNTPEMPERDEWKNQMVSSSFHSFRQKKELSVPFETYTAEPIHLKDHLLWQAQMDSFSEKEKNILSLLISHLNDDGYLPVSLEELRESSVLKMHSPEDFQQALRRLQDMDPPGVGARNLKECLLAQARFMEEDTRDMELLIQNHLPHLEKRNYQMIASDLKISIEEVKELVGIISSMDPAPARGFYQPPSIYITPDVYIYRDGADYKVAVNNEGMPTLHLSSQATGWLKKSGRKTEDVKKYVKERTQAGQWFIRSLMQRHETILKVTESLVRHQRDFLDQGLSALKPLILQDVADDVSMHISTVSRVTSNKYAHTPRGVIPLKRFFSAGIRDKQGRSIPVELIKIQIKKLISEESSRNPLSDSRLTACLQDTLGMTLNRRTVAQYRDSMEILPASRRKQAV
ncbi:MAG: RNA polymerase factor sigma-54 [Bdellovibrionales bacterium]|nr:RNA polymerase factor sigma-54 [Bdellovibrionales bacterium]